MLYSHQFLGELSPRGEIRALLSDKRIRNMHLCPFELRPYCDIGL